MRKEGSGVTTCASCTRIKTCGASGYEKNPENLRRPNLCPLWTDLDPDFKIMDDKPVMGEQVNVDMHPLKAEGAAVKPLHTIEYERKARELADSIASYNSHSTNGNILALVAQLEQAALQEGVRIGADSLCDKLIRTFTEV